jgi:hypothetical protein
MSAHRFFERYAWFIPFSYGLLILAASAFWLVWGTPFDTATYHRVAGMPWGDIMAASHPRVPAVVSALVRFLGGNFGLLSGILVIAVAVTAFRSGERWAWFAMLALPLHSLIDPGILIHYDALAPASLAWDCALIVYTLLGILLPVKTFFN